MAESCALGGLQQQGPYQKGLPLKAGEALSLSYWLFPDPSLPPREFRVRSGTVLWHERISQQCHCRCIWKVSSPVAWNVAPAHSMNEHHCQGSLWQVRFSSTMQSMQVAVSAFYQTPDAATRFATTFFNQTIDIVETKKMVDFELISLYATILALLAGVGAPPQMTY